MKIEKRNGGYRVQPMRNGKRYSLTFDHKPTKADIEHALADAIMNDNKCGSDMTFYDACVHYADGKKNVLSPSTYREHMYQAKRYPKWFKEKSLSEITQNDINRLVNELALDKAPSTVARYHSIVASVLGTFRPEFHIKTTMPRKKTKEPYIPTDEDIKRILNAIKGSEYEIPILLMCYGLRRSEVVALSIDDFEDNRITIDKSLVMDIDGKWVEKETKTEKSTRTIYVDDYVASLVQEQGYIYKGDPQRINLFLSRQLDMLGIPHFSVHKLRHYFASKMSQLGIPDADIMKMGGWKTDRVMKSVYRHSLQTEEKNKKVAQMFSDALFN